MEKRVLLIRNIVPDFYGGGETYQLKLAEQLKKDGFKPYIVTSSKKLFEEGRRLGFNVIKAPYNFQQNWSGARNLLFPKYFMWQKSLEKWYGELFDKIKPITVNIQSRDDFIAATLAAKERGIKILWTDHMDFRSWVMKNVTVPYKNLIGKWILKCAEKVNTIIMISDYEKNAFCEYYDGGNVVVIKNGAVDEKKEHMAIKAVPHSFVFVGRVVDYKGIAELLMAFSKVRGKYPKAVLNIYGAGEIDEFKKIAGEGVVFHGETKEPLKALAENDVFVLPSYREGLSLSLLDAAMMGKKIIASDVDGNPEVIENKVSGLLVPAKSAEKLAEAMMWMIENPREASKMAQKARKQYEEKFDFEKIFAEKMLPLYNNRKELK